MMVKKRADIAHVTKHVNIALVTKCANVALVTKCADIGNAPQKSFRRGHTAVAAPAFWFGQCGLI